ncbi:MAG: histidine--tRNA ligase [Thermoproteota archaeon]
MDKAFGVLRGFRELTPEEFELERLIVEKAREIFELYGYQEVGIPTVEPTGIFEIKSGEEIRHRMFRFTDMGGREVCLRPEGTPAIARMVTTRMRDRPLPIRVGYVGNMFRYDEPQRGRYREFLQMGIEMVGSSEPQSDAEVILAVNEFMKRLGFREHSIRLGHEGILRGILENAGVREDLQNAILSRIDRGKIEEAFEIYDNFGGDETHRKTLGALLKPIAGGGSEKVERVKDLVEDIEECRLSLQNLKEINDILVESGVENLNVDVGFARGLEYYTGMIFEIYCPGIEFALAGGGRYDKLLALFGWDVPAVGCAVGVDRVALAIKEKGIFVNTKKVERVILASIDRESLGYAFQTAKRLRETGVGVALEPSPKAPGNVISKARKAGVRFVCFVGPKEVKDNVVSVRDLRNDVDFVLDPEGVAKVMISKEP